MKIIYLIIINIISFLLFGIDKKRSIKKEYRISEYTLISISFLGGAIGSILGMIIFHHKTKKSKFIILIPIALLINIFILINI